MSMNPFCEIAVEEALWLHEAGAAAEVVAATVGPAQAADTLHTALAMGADRAVHVLHDPDPACPLLPLAVAKILRALALQECPGLIILGKQVRSLGKRDSAAARPRLLCPASIWPGAVAGREPCPGWRRPTPRSRRRTSRTSKLSWVKKRLSQAAAAHPRRLL